MAIHVEPRRTGEHIRSEESRSREEVTIAAGNLKPGTVLAKNASGDYVILNPTGSNGTNIVAGVLHSAVDATEGPVRAVIHDMATEFVGELLVWPEGITAPQKAIAISQIRALNSKVR